MNEGLRRVFTMRCAAQVSPAAASDAATPVPADVITRAMHVGFMARSKQYLAPLIALQVARPGAPACLSSVPERAPSRRRLFVASSWDQMRGK